MSDQLELLFRAGTPLVSIQTTDEDRALEIVSEVTDKLSWCRFEWSLVSGMKQFKPNSPVGAQISKPYDPAGALEQLMEQKAGAMFVFKDLGPHTKDAKIHRLIRECSRMCAEQDSAMTLVDALPLPDEINRFTVRYEIGWPDVDELEQVVRETFSRIKREIGSSVKASLTGQDMYQLVQTLRGLSKSEAERIVASAILDDGKLSAEDLSNIVEAKRTLLGTSGCLESIAADFSIDDIGGLSNLKNWLRQRRGGFTRDARKFGIEPPRGVLMLGVPGCGKSLCAKVVASDWKMSLLRL
ncbi:MAG: ATPase, partial [Planctomycetaceae bacterium]